jgi:hypothetical protein
VAEAGDGREALELTKKHLPNVVLIAEGKTLRRSHFY